MGAKYLPTIKDLKASQRFQQQQAALVRQKKLVDAQARNKHEKKNPPIKRSTAE